MTPKDFAEAMRIIADQADADDGDVEEAHARADRLMLVVLRELGYADGADIFDRMSKWYA